MLTLPPLTIPIESLRDWLIAGDAGAPPGDDCEARFAAVLAAGVPAAWALFQDVVRPRFVASLVPFFRDPREAVTLADSVAGELYASRDTRSPNGITDLPSDVSIFHLCRARAHVRLVNDAREEAASFAPADDVDTIELARALADDSLDADPRFSEYRRLEARVAPEMRTLALAEQLARQRPGSHDRAAPVRILNLPAVLTLLFLCLMAIATFYILDQPATDRTDRTMLRLADAINSNRFDEAVRLLADDPPPGLEHLEPVRPEARIQRIRELRSRKLDPQPLEILAPFGRIDELRPQIVWRGVDLHGELKLRIIHGATGTIVLERNIAVDQYHVDIGKDLVRGCTYTVALEHPRAAAQGHFEILTEEARNYVERRVADVSALAADSNPRTLAFLRAHVYRAEDCVAASLGEWRRLRGLVPTSSYPREEAAWTFDVELRFPRRALLELNATGD